MSTVIRVENLSKYYRLGLIGGKTLHDDLNRWWARVRKQPDPLLKIGQEDHRNGNDEYIWALRDINFEVQQGEIVGIIGRNGAGKSTLLKILSRITAPTSGQVKVKGRIASLLEVGTGFHPELTGRENIYLNGAILGMKKAEIDRKFDEIVAFAEVEKFIDTPVKRYSSGMYVRLAFAVAAHLEPEILVVDEVLAVGDVAFQKKCLGKMGDVAKEGRTVFFVSHNMAAIQLLCTRVVHFKSGQIAGVGAVGEQVELYLNDCKYQLDITLNNPFQLCRSLQLRKFAFHPNPVSSGDELRFDVEFWSDQTIRIDELAILIYSSLGMRVAILDLRVPGLSYKLNSTKGYRICGSVNSFPLVEGEYRIGLFLNSSAVTGDFFDLAVVTVNGRTMSEGIVPYHRMYRGVLELDFILSSNNTIS